MKKFFFPAILLVLLTGCFQLVVIEPNEARPLIFQSEYTNHAWGYSHNGWLMDHSGTVKRFQKSAQWVFPDTLGYISETDMQKNMNGCDSVLTHISSYELNHFSAKALSCVNGKLTDPKNTMADAGEHIYAFYIYDSHKMMYKRIVLSMVGDFSQENLAPNAKDVVEWMMKIK
jgi:uncharacterized protein YceK